MPRLCVFNADHECIVGNTSSWSRVRTSEHWDYGTSCRIFRRLSILSNFSRRAKYALPSSVTHRHPYRIDQLERVANTPLTARCRTPRDQLRAQRHPLRKSKPRECRRSLSLARRTSFPSTHAHTGARGEGLTQLRKQANVMLAYPIPEAEALLEQKLEAARQSLRNCEDDLDFLREQITVSSHLGGRRA